MQKSVSGWGCECFGSLRQRMIFYNYTVLILSHYEKFQVSTSYRRWAFRMCCSYLDTQHTMLESCGHQNPCKFKILAKHILIIKPKISILPRKNWEERAIDLWGLKHLVQEIQQWNLKIYFNNIVTFYYINIYITIYESLKHLSIYFKYYLKPITFYIIYVDLLLFSWGNTFSS